MSIREPEIMNARVTSVAITRDPVLSAWINIEGAGWGVGFGGFCLKAEYASKWFDRVFETLEVDSWEKIAGMPVRAKTEGAGGVCLAIGHFLKDQWFEPRVEWRTQP